MCSAMSECICFCACQSHALTGQPCTADPRPRPPATPVAIFRALGPCASYSCHGRRPRPSATPVAIFGALGLGALSLFGDCPTQDCRALKIVRQDLQVRQDHQDRHDRQDHQDCHWSWSRSRSRSRQSGRRKGRRKTVCPCPCP